MIQFIKNKDAGEEYMQLFSIARTPEEAFHVWKRAKELNVDVCIDNKMLGNDWEARYAIEQHFGVSYTIQNTMNEDVGISLSKIDLQIIIKALESDKILNPQARKMLIDKLNDLHSGGASFIDYLG